MSVKHNPSDGKFGLFAGADIFQPRVGMAPRGKMPVQTPRSVGRTVTQNAASGARNGGVGRNGKPKRV